MRRALLEGIGVFLTGLLSGVGAWLLSANVWLALPICALGAALSQMWLQHRNAWHRGEAQRLATHLSIERERHDATRQFIQRLLDVVPMPIYVKDADSRVIIINRAQAEQWGLAREDLIGTHSFNQAPDPERTRLTHEEDMKVLGGERVYKEEHTPDGNMGQEQFRVITKGRCEDADGNYVIVCARFDTTRWRQAERELQQALEREKLLRQRNQEFIQRAIDVIPDPFYIKDRHGRLLMVNEAYACERGRKRESVIGVLSTALEITPELAADTAREDQAVLHGAVIDKEQHYIHPHSGEDRYRLVAKRPCTDMDGQPVIVVAHINITRWKIAEQKLERMAHQDELTGLPNRRHFLVEAERLISIATRHASPLSLIIFDIDHFKQINDAHGHAIGDLALQEVAKRLMQQLRGEDLPSRWGGEEFVILLPMTDLSSALPIAERLRDAFAAAPVAVQGLTLPLTISGGVAQKLASESLNDCLDRADKALYAAKNAGRNCFLPA